MRRSAQKLREDAQQIWWAGVEAARPARLVPQHLVIEGESLWIGDREFDLQAIDRIVIVGTGKASGAMTAAVEDTLGETILKAKHVSGWVNVPADCVSPTRAVRLFPARPPGVNEPTAASVEGTREIMRLVGSLGVRDFVLCLISGGGSALLTAPTTGLSLGTKVAVTREIVARGGDIYQLNAVRSALSDVKGGGLARACRAGHLATLILSDVPGDDLKTIASGPTVLDEATPEAALAALDDLGLTDHPLGLQVRTQLQQNRVRTAARPSCEVTNLVIGNIATAVDGAGVVAERLGYSHAMFAATAAEGTAEEVGRWLAGMADSMRSMPGPDCLISGGEPTVKLVAEGERGRGGRNQQLALAALASLDDGTDLAIVSGGTDGEDGPTDAAGALVDASVLDAAREQGVLPDVFLNRNDAYSFFEKAGGLLKTGPTGTNVCDLRVVCVNKPATLQDDAVR